MWLQDVSPEGYKRRAEHHLEMVREMDELIKLYSSSISNEMRIIATLFREQHSEAAIGIMDCPLYLMPLNSIGAGGICFSFLETIEWMRFEKIVDFETLYQRMFAYPLQASQYITSMKEGISRGYIASNAMTINVEKQIQDLLEGG